MSLISSTIPNLVNGVSQQPYSLRLSSQGELQENGLSTVAEGLRKRPPTEHLAKVQSTPLTNAFIHKIDRDGDEQYQVIVTPGGLRVFTLAGVEKSVDLGGTTYLNTAEPADQAFALTTVADYTFVVNKYRTVEAAASVVPVRPFEALINVKLGNFGKTYSIYVDNNLVANYATPTGADTADAPKLDAVFIAIQLTSALQATVLGSAPWTLSRFGSVIRIANSAADFRIAADDGFGNQAMVAIKGKLQKFSDLPANARTDGFTVEIVGDQTTGFDNYWVRFDSKGQNNNTGVWRECAAPGISTGLNPLTMPHQLVRNANGTFTFAPAPWATRIAGDADSNPHPSFVGRTINDVFFFQNRLGLLSDENYFQSEAGKYFNCYRTTVAALLDSDPVDVSAATNKVAILEHAVSFNKQLVLFSSQQQFSVDGEKTVTPKDVPIAPTTDFIVSTRAKPAASGKSIYFATEKGDWSSVWEFFVEPQNLTNDASDVTAHVPKYVPSNIIKIAAGPNEDVLAFLSADDPNHLYVYRYYFSGNEKLQSSWSKFVFPATDHIVNCDFLGSALYLVVSRADGLYFEKMDFSAGAAATTEPYVVHLDRKVTVPRALMSFTGSHTIVNVAALGYNPNDGTYMAVAHGGGTVLAGQLFTQTSASPLRFLGDLTGTEVTVGRKYLFRYGVSPLLIRSPTPQGGTKAETDGRTQVRHIAFDHTNTGLFSVKVTPDHRATYTYTYSGMAVGTITATIGRQTFPDGRFVVPVMSRNTQVSITIESDSPLPLSILGADWEAFFVKRSRPV